MGRQTSKPSGQRPHGRPTGRRNGGPPRGHRDSREAPGRYAGGDRHRQSRGGHDRHGRADRRVFAPGDDTIGWCRTCNLPALGKTCGVCRKPPERVRLSPPTDIRPASRDGLDLLCRLLEEDYGCGGLLRDRFVLLNKVAGEDRTDEVYVDGRLFGVLEFDLRTLSHRFRPRLFGAGILLGQEGAKGRTVVCRKKELGGRHLKGKRIGGGHIERFPDGIRAGDPVLITVGQLAGHGVALRDGPFAPDSSMEPWVRVREIGHPESALAAQGGSMERAVEANVSHLRELERRAVWEVKEAMGRLRLPVNVGFSGGKDSLALAGIARKALRELIFVFSDTGLEFPETQKYVKEAAKEFGAKLVVLSGEADFWGQLDEYGPPAKDFRWCCKTQKLSPIAGWIADKYRMGCITLDGRRRYESTQRAGISAVESNPFIPGQRLLSPIRNWRALDVWLYIRWRALRPNPLYDMDFERIGCWLCPSAPVSELENLRRTHPKMYARWKERLHRWGEASKVDPRFIDTGMWRWRTAPPKVKALAEEMGMSLPGDGEEEASAMRMPPPAERCGTDGLTVEARMSLPPRATVSRVAVFFGMLGETRLAEELGVVTLDGDGVTATFHGSGHLVVRGRDPHHLRDGYRDIITAIMQAAYCSECGVCVKKCPTGALSPGDPLKLDRRRCDGCLTCREGCVVVQYMDRLPAPKVR